MTDLDKQIDANNQVARAKWAIEQAVLLMSSPGLDAGEVDPRSTAFEQTLEIAARKILAVREALPNHEGHQGATTPAANPDQEAKQ